MKNINFDIDIDVVDRDKVLEYFDHVNASKITGDKIEKHNTGIYITDILTTAGNLATIDYKEAEQRGYFKLDILNVNLYKQVIS